jgi:peptidyl-prolyl cis-trans isomerase C
VVLLGGCARDSGPDDQAASVATVDRDPLSGALYARYVERKTGADPANVDPALRQHLLDDLIALKAAAAAGERLHDGALELDVELARLDVYAAAAAARAHVDDPPTAPELDAAYRAFIAALPGREYHVADVQVPTEILALDVVHDLDAGGDFAQIARIRSADDSKDRGGDLGWLAADQIPREFSDAVGALKPGEYTRTPVHTADGWYVIRLLETRPADAPPFERVKAQLRAGLRKDRYEAFLKTAVERAKVERKPPG